MRILFVSALSPGTSGAQRLGALRHLGHDIFDLALDSLDRRGGIEMRLRNRLLLRSPFRANDESTMGEALAASVLRCSPDIVWIEKALLLTAAGLDEARKNAPKALFVCFQDDDPFGLRTRDRSMWSNFISAIPSYDLHFVKREANVAEFSKARARRVLLFMHGVYGPIFHATDSVESSRLRPLVFVGTPLDHRVEIIRRLVEHHRLPLEIFGNSWHRTNLWRPHRRLFHAAVIDEQYADVLRASQLALGFVSSSNRDEYSMRTFEIPACGAMLLAERTIAHQSLFDEGQEAEFFASPDECADKCRFYLNHEAQRRRIAAAGHAKVSRPEHSLVWRMRDALVRAGVRDA